MFKASLKNNNIPELGTVTVEFPIPEAQYEETIRALNGIQSGAVVEQDCFVADIGTADCPALERLIGTMANVDELDWLGKQLESFDRYELLQFNAAVERFGLSAADELIDLSFCAREVTVISDFTDLEKTGKRHYLTVHGACDSEELENLDGKETALALISGQPGYVTRFGVVYDNGIKLIDCYGEKMPEETLLLVEDYIDGKLHVFDQDWPELPFAHREHIGCTVDYVAGRNRYMGYLISLGIYSFKGIKVGLDCANGASWNIAKSVFDALGADTYVINNQPNGLNINLNAGSTHIEGLQKFVVEKGLDVGFAYDGDADRCLCVDEKGNVITGDHILYIYGCYMKERGKLLTNTVVTTVMSNFGLYKAFDEQGIGYAKTAVGDKYVYEYMAKNGCRIGGEQSGHIIFSKYASTGDGILTSLKMMEVMLAKKKPLSALAAPLKIYPQVLENVRVTDKKAAQDDAAVQAAVKAVAEALGDTGRILVRESGTEPVVRVMVEAPDHDTCQKYVSQVVDVIKAQGYSV